MGKATILSGGAGGLYNVTLDYGHQKKLDEIAAINSRISQIVVNLVGANAALASEDAAVAAAQSNIDSAVTDYELAVQANVSDLTPFQTAITEAINALAEANQRRLPVSNAKGFLDAEKSNLEARRDYLLSLNLRLNTQAWCADLTEDGAGEVGTIEVPGEPKKTLIVPGAAAPTPADGQVVAREVQRYDQAFFNAALLPGWQKFKPTYRTGEIFNINEDVCSVDLDYEESTPRELPINQADILNNVPIEYLSCNGAAFEEGDKVVVKFEDQDWNSPKVIGFVSNPKSCGPILIFKIKIVSAETIFTERNGGSPGFGAGAGFISGRIPGSFAVSNVPFATSAPTPRQFYADQICIGTDIKVYVSKNKSQILQAQTIQEIKNLNLDIDFVEPKRIASFSCGFPTDTSLNKTVPTSYELPRITLTRTWLNDPDIPEIYSYVFNLNGIITDQFINQFVTLPFRTNTFFLEKKEISDENLVLSFKGNLSNGLIPYGSLDLRLSPNGDSIRPVYSGRFFWDTNEFSFTMDFDKPSYTTLFIDRFDGGARGAQQEEIFNEISLNTLPEYSPFGEGFRPKKIIKYWSEQSWSNMNIQIYNLFFVSDGNGNGIPAEREVLIQDSFYFAVEYE